MAKLILLNYSPDVRRGSEDVLAILFDMNLLWELFVYRTLKKGESKGGYKVSAQNQKKFWNSRRIRPDLVLNWEDGRCVVIDTKWKLIDDFRPADTDLKQMYAYNMYWQTRRLHPIPLFSIFVLSHSETCRPVTSRTWPSFARLPKSSTSPTFLRPTVPSLGTGS